MTADPAASVVAQDDPARDWTAPGAFRVAPGVFRIPLPLPHDGLRAVNVYAVEDGDGLVLVDSGWALEASRDALAAALDGLGRGLGDVRRFLVTHVHRDHYTQAVALRREFGVEVALGVGERPSLDLLAGTGDPRGWAFRARLRAAGAPDVLDRAGMPRIEPDPDPVTWAAPDVWLADGATAAAGERVLTAIATPGHTRGHLVFRDAAGGLLFAGDHVLPRITPSIGFESAPADFPLRDFLESLRLVRALPDTRLLPAHGPVADSTHRRIDELLAHHDRRLALIADLVGAGASTAAAVAERMTWTRRGRRLAELDPFNTMLAVLETLAHLDLLALQGRARGVDVAGIRHFQVA